MPSQPKCRQDALRCWGFDICTSEFAFEETADAGIMFFVIRFGSYVVFALPYFLKIWQ
jgi:hypothetical protein